MDGSDIVVHLFDPEERKNYGIENYGLIQAICSSRGYFIMSPQTFAIIMIV